MGGSPATPKFEISAPEFEITAADGTPDLRPEVEAAIRKVPIPRPDYMQTESLLPKWLAGTPAPTAVSPEAQQLERDVTQSAPKQRPSASALAATAAELFTNPDVDSVGTEPGVGKRVERGLKQVAIPGQRGTGALNLAAAGTEALTPFMGPAAIENPVSIAKGLAEGTVASKGVGYGARKLGATPEQQSAAEDLAFWMPGVARSVLGPKASLVSTPEVKGGTVGVRGAGAAVAVTPEGVRLGGRLGPLRGSVSIPRNVAPAPAGLEPPTIEGSQVAVDPASQALAQHEIIQQRAARVAQGMPPVEPQPATPASPKVTEITQNDITRVAEIISKLLPNLRSQGMLEAHQTMARILQENGRVIGPDGKLLVIDSPKAAEKAAAQMVNDEVERQDKLAEEAAKGRTPSSSEKGAAQAGVAPSKRPTRAQARAVEQKTFEVAAPEPKFEIAAPEKAEVESSDGATVPVSVEPHGQEGANLPGAGAGQHEQLLGGVSERQAQGSNQPQRAEEVRGAGTGGADTHPANLPGGIAGSDEGSANPANSLQKAGFVKGQQVRFSKDFPVRKGQNQEVAETIPQGTTAFVEHAGEGMNFVRLRLPDGRKLSVNQRAIEQVPEGSVNPPKASGVEPGQVGSMKLSDLKLAPNRFQYKLGTDAEGVSSLLKEQDQFKPDLAGVVSVWRDPQDGKVYVINGHHRFELAKRTGQKEIAVRHIVAPTAERARSIGALQNIAEGRGTPVDAAKFFRDTGMTPEKIKDEGISLGEATVRQGHALSRLDTPLFNKVVSGDLRPGRAVAIGEATNDPAEQKAILNLVDKKEARGQKISDGVLSELIRFVKESGREKETTADLFGSQEITKSLALEKAEVSDYIRQQLAKDRKLFGFVSKEGRAEDLARAGNKIEVEKSKEISTGAQQAEEVYNRLSGKGGEISDILDQAARRLAGKENPATVKSDAYKSIRDAVSKALSGRTETSTQGREGVSGRGGEQSQTPLTLTHVEEPLNLGFSLISDRSPEAWAKIANFAYATPVRDEGIKPYAKLTTQGMWLVSRALRRNILGASIPEKNAEELYYGLNEIAEKVRPVDQAAAENIEKLIKDLKSVEQPKTGITVAPDRGRLNAEQDLRILHEELIHAELQHAPGKGVLAKGVPAELINDPGIQKMKPRIDMETRAGYIPEITIAEGFADIATGTPNELSPEEAEATARKYYQAIAEMYGPEILDKAQQLQDYIDRLAEERDIIPAGEKFNERENGPARKALADTRREVIGDQGTVRRRGDETAESSGRTETGEGSGQSLESSPGSAPANHENVQLRSTTGEAGRGTGSTERTATEPKATLASSQPIGLTDEELETWSKSKSFHVEEAGEQANLFGEPQKIFRVSRIVDGEKQTGLVYEDQLKAIEQDKHPGQESLFHRLHKDESGEFDTGPVAKAAGTVSSFLKQELEDTRRARELQWEMYDLDKRHEGRVLRAKQLLERLQDEGVTQEDRKAIDDHLDALEADSDSVPVPPLTAKQDEILDKVLLPLKEEAEAAFKKVTEGGLTIPNYNPRQTKGKGGMLDRFISKQGQRWSGRANMLSKSMPATKHRVMMALELENPSRQGSLLYKKGDRLVVSLNGGQVTAWKDGQPENLGGISVSDEGRVFEDKDGNVWTLKQATKNEIEKDSGVRYYHDAAASTIVNWLQAKKAEAAYDFVENFKQAPEFKDIAMPTGQGNPPKGWRTTNLPQFKGYYFEPHTAEVFDWFFDRLKSGDPNAFDALNSFMRAKILLNPIKHPINIGAHWMVERGASGFMPQRMYRLAKTGARAINAVWNQNQDYLDALEAGAPLQSAHDATRDLVKLFYEQLADASERGEPWATKAAKAIGFPPTTLVQKLHTLSSKIAWPASDMMFLQAAYEYQETHPNTSLKDAFREVGRIIPEYRLPVRILNSTVMGKIMASKWGTIFGSYHYGELRAFSESAKSAFGMGEKAPGKPKAGDVAKGWDRLAMMALGMVLLGGAIRKLLQQVTGEKDAEPAYPGIFGLLHAADRVARKEETPTQALTKAVTPNPATMGALQLAFNRDLQTGRHIYDPAAKWDVEAEQLMHYLKENLSPMGSEIERASHTDEGWKKFAWNQLDVNFPKHGAEALAQQIASAKLDTSAMTTEEREKYYARQKAIDALRRGDTAGLEEGIEKGQLSAEDISKLIRRSTLTGLADKVHDFTFEELMRVYEKADEQQQEELLPLLLEKQEHLLEQGRIEEAVTQ